MGYGITIDLNTIIPRGEKIVHILEYLPVEEYEFSSNIYLIETLENKYILKEFPENHTNKNEILNNDIISQLTTCRIPKIVNHSETCILMEYIDGVELSKLVEYDALSFKDLEIIAEKTGKYFGEIIFKCQHKDASQIKTSSFCNKDFNLMKMISLLPFNVELMMIKEYNEWCIGGMLDLELMKYGDVKEYVDYIQSSNSVMIPGIKKRIQDSSRILNKIYVESLILQVGLLNRGV